MSEITGARYMRWLSEQALKSTPTSIGVLRSWRLDSLVRPPSTNGRSGASEGCDGPWHYSGVQVSSRPKWLKRAAAGAGNLYAFLLSWPASSTALRNCRTNNPTLSTETADLLTIQARECLILVYRPRPD
jgi:hypothetical protein